MLKIIEGRLAVHTSDEMYNIKGENPNISQPSFCLATVREAYRNNTQEDGMGRGTEYGSNIDRRTCKTLNQVAQILNYRDYPLLAEHAIASMFDGITGVYIRK